MNFFALREIAQIPFESARAAFPMADSSYPPEWKEQIRQLSERLMAAQLELGHPEDVLQVLAFTNLEGRRPRHGTAANLALTMASHNDTRVLIIDANPIEATLHRALHRPAGPGLGEATRAGLATLPQCFHRITGTQVYMLTVGEPSAYPIDLRGLHDLLRSLRSQFDWILIDAPGFDALDDAVAINLAADGVIMLIESERDNFRMVAEALRKVQGSRLLGAVMY